MTYFPKNSQQLKCLDVPGILFTNMKQRIEQGIVRNVEPLLQQRGTLEFMVSRHQNLQIQEASNHQHFWGHSINCHLYPKILEDFSKADTPLKGKRPT